MIARSLLFTANQRGKMPAAWLYIVLSIHCLLFGYSAVLADAMPGLDSERAIGSDRSADSNQFEENIPVPATNSDNNERNFVNAVASGAPESFVGDDLFAKARLHGSVRVIVQFRIAPGRDDAREKSIEIARRALLDELAPVAHRVVRSFTAMPAVVLEASLDALQILKKSSRVLRVDEDELVAPLIDAADRLGPIHGVKKRGRSI